MVKRLALVICFFFSLINISFAENKQKMDSLKVALHRATQDTIKLNLYISILEECDFENNLMFTEPALILVNELINKNTNRIFRKILLAKKIKILDFLIPFYANKGKQEKRLEFHKMQLDIFIELKDTTNIINSLETLSGVYKLIGNIPKSLAYNQLGIAFFKQMNYLKGQEIFMSQLANLYLESGDTTSALNKLNEILKINILLKDTDNIAYSHERIGYIFLDKKDTSEAKVKFKTAIKLILEIKKSKFVSYMNLSRIARMYSRIGDYKSSLTYAKLALEKSQTEDNGNGYSEMLYINGVLYSVAGDTIQSIYYHKKRNEEREKNGFYGLNFSYYHLARIYLIQKNLKLAKINVEKHLASCKKVGIIEYMGDAELLHSSIDSAMGNFKDAYFHFKNYDNIKHQIKSDEVKQAANREKYQKEYDKQKAIEKDKQNKKDALAKIASQRQNTILIFVIIGLIIVLIFATFIYRSLNIRKKQNKLIARQKTAIEASYKNLELLNNISNEITASLNLTSVMELIYKNVKALMDVSFFIISTYDNLEDSVDVKFCVKEGIIVPIAFKTYLSNPKSVMTALTVKGKKEIIVNDWEVEYKNYNAEVSQLKDKNDLYCDSMIWIPLLIKDEVIGLFSVQSIKKNAFSRYNVDMLRSLSSIIAVALNNAEAYHKLDTAKFEITAQKNIVEEKQKEILDSIAYALRIQTAILPPQKIVKQYLQNSFILYKPKDIVAGDFYWMETVQFENEKQFDSDSYQNLKMKKDESNFQIEKSSNSQIILFAACDCTGHGVPGAMVSVVCHNALNRAVREFGLTKPSEILDKTQEIVLENFSKSEEDIKDGMDISLCALYFNKVQNFVKVELQYAGANNPLWLIHKGDFVEIKADKQPIGMNEDSKVFTNHTIELQQGDSIYIFSDGFADQFSPADKKLMKKNFKNLLLNIQNKSMHEQHEYLNTYIENWKGNMEQTDDILVIGVRV